MAARDAVETTDATEAIRERVRSCVARSTETQREFASRVGLDPPKLSRSLRGTRQFSTPELLRIATVCGVTVNWLLTGSDFAPGAVAVPAPSALPWPVREDAARGEKRHEIVTVAWELFADRGFHATQMSEIARTCAVSPSILHYYFAGKRELFEECLRYSVKLAFDRQVAGLDDLQDPRARLVTLFDLQLPLTPGMRREWSIWLQSWTAVAVGAGSSGNSSTAYRRWFRAVRDVVVEGQQAGVFVDEPAEDLATDLTALFDGLGIKVLVGTLTPEAMRERMHRHLERAVLAGSTSGEGGPAPGPHVHPIPPEGENPP